eukprot:16173601-Heterocapsa_arctica.AAC.1
MRSGVSNVIKRTYGKTLRTALWRSSKGHVLATKGKMRSGASNAIKRIYDKNCIRLAQQRSCPCHKRQDAIWG